MSENPWRDLPANPPYVLPADAPSIAAFNHKLRPDQERYRIQLDTVIPEPFVGDPRRAAIVILLANAGYKTIDDEAHADPAFRTALLQNLRHAKADYPFYFLDPAFHSTPGGVWWRQRLRLLIDATSLETVAEKVACVEWFTYKSTSFKPCQVPSQAYGFSLVQAALDRGAIVIPLRSYALWQKAVPTIADQPELVTTSSTQNVYLTPRNLKLNGEKTPAAFDLLVERLG